MKYAVITYIFGRNKEILREPLVIDKDVEYICVTDQKSLKSKTWKIIYDGMSGIKSLRDKMAYVKYNPFKYTNAGIAMTIDGSLEIKKSLIPMFESMNGYDIGLKKHTVRFNLKQELPCWILRGLPEETVRKFEIMAKTDKINLENVPLYETCVVIHKNTNICKVIGQTNLKYMKFLGNNGNLIITNQCPLSYIMSLYFKSRKIFYINQFEYFNRYTHNTQKINKS